MSKHTSGIRHAALAIVLLAGSWGRPAAGQAAAPQATAAWPLPAERILAADAARFTPPDLKRQIVKHRDRLMAGVTDAADADRHTRDAATHRAAAARASKLIAQKIRDHQPFADVVYEFGGIIHELAAASPPAAQPVPERPTFAGYPSDPFGSPDRLIVSATGYDAAVTSATRLLTWIWKTAGGDCSSTKSYPESRGPFVIRE